MPPKFVGDNALEKSMRPPEEVPEGVGICNKSLLILPYSESSRPRVSPELIDGLSPRDVVGCWLWFCVWLC